MIFPTIQYEQHTESTENPCENDVTVAQNENKTEVELCLEEVLDVDDRKTEVELYLEEVLDVNGCKNRGGTVSGGSTGSG